MAIELMNTKANNSIPDLIARARKGNKGNRKAEGALSLKPANALQQEKSSKNRLQATFWNCSSSGIFSITRETRPTKT